MFWVMQYCVWSRSNDAESANDVCDYGGAQLSKNREYGIAEVDIT